MTRHYRKQPGLVNGTVSLLTFPELGLAIAAAANVTNASGVDRLALGIAEAFAGRRNR